MGVVWGAPVLTSSLMDPVDQAKQAANLWATKYGGMARMMTFADRQGVHPTYQGIDPTQWCDTRIDCEVARHEWESRYPTVRFEWPLLPRVWPAFQGLLPVDTSVHILATQSSFAVGPDVAKLFRPEERRTSDRLCSCRIL